MLIFQNRRTKSKLVEIGSKSGYADDVLAKPFDTLKVKESLKPQASGPVT